MSAARHAYGLHGVAVANESRRVQSGMLPLLILVIGLAVATTWFVALPAFDEPPAKRSCEVVFLESGATKCVEKRALASPAAPETPKRSNRPRR